jgi:hypothetical protein
MKYAVAFLLAALLVWVLGPIAVDTTRIVNRAWCKILNLECGKPEKVPCVFRMGRGVCIR